jgi:hypothetical protein
MKLKKIAAVMAMLLSSATANSAITDGAFGVNQIFDVQYYWSGNTLNASNFIAPYDSTFQTVTVSSGQYFKFIDNGNGTYGLGLYNSDNTLARTIHSTGTITALGSGAIFYIGSGFFGNVISTAEGYSYGDSATFTNMDTSVTSSDLSSYTWASTTPLADGQTAGSSSTPTVVSTVAGTPIVTTTSVVGSTTSSTSSTAVVSEDKSKQTVTTTTTVTQTTPTTTTTCTTPTTVTTYSDNSVVTTNGTQSCANSTTTSSTSSSSVDSISGRIDQMSVLADLNKQLDRGLNMDAFRRDGLKQGDLTLYLNGNASKTSLDNGYNAKGDGWGIGIEKKIQNDWSVGVQYNRIGTRLNGVDSSTSQDKNHVGIYSIYNLGNATIVNNLGYSRNDIANNRTIGNVLGNNHSTTGDNLWLNNRIYSPQYNGFRPFAGVTVGRSAVAGYTESGSVLTARTVAKEVSNYSYGEAGIRYDKKLGKFILAGEAGTTTDQLSTGLVSIGYAPTDIGVITLAVGAQNYKGINTNSISLRGIIRF